MTSIGKFMGLFQEIIIAENHKASQKELEYTHSLINKTYNEWRKIRRRINAVDIITTTVNRIIKMNPESIQFLNDEMKMKMAILIMRCMDNPYWKPVSNKEKLYTKLFPLIKPLENFALNTGTNGTLKQIIMTRLSANLAMQDEHNKGKVMVCYEPTMPIAYSRYLLGEHKPDKVYKMQALSMPEDFETLIHIIRLDLDKAMKKASAK
jgi:hypothetical protein